MPKLRDLKGQAYGNLTVKSFVGYLPKKGTQWLCECKCGNEIVVKSSSLVGKNTRSCGCLRRQTLPKGVAALNEVYREYATGAERRGFPFCLTVEQFLGISQGVCFYCGTEPSERQRHKYRHSEFKYNGIDRVDSRYGYSLENCVPCCKVCNRMKSNMTKDDFLSHISKIQVYNREHYQ